MYRKKALGILAMAVAALLLAGCFQEAAVTESWTGPSNGTASTQPRKGLVVQRANGTIEVVPLNGK